MTDILGATFRRSARIGGAVGATIAQLVEYLARSRFLAPAGQKELLTRSVKRYGKTLADILRVERVTAGAFSQGARGRLVVANHRSAIDIPILLELTGGHMVSKSDVANWPLLGLAATRAGTIYVDRSDSLSGVSAIRVMRTLLSDGETVCIFPEGTTFAGDEVQPFHPGSFLAALRTNAEIVPVGIAYEENSGAEFLNETFGNHVLRICNRGPKRAAIFIGSPIVVGEKARAAALAEQTQIAVQEAVNRARALVGRG